MNATVPNAANPPVKRLDDRWAYKLRGAYGFFFLLPGTLLALFSKPFIQEQTWASVACDALAWLVFFAGVTFRIWACLYVGSRKLKTLVSQGPYSVCRNPLYVGSFLMAVGSAFFFKSLIVAIGVVLTMAAYTLATVPAEEEALLRVHGEPYRKYLAQVPRYFPKFSLLSSPEDIEVKLNGLRIEAKRLFIWIWLPVVAEVFGHLRAQDWWPHLMRLP